MKQSGCNLTNYYERIIAMISPYSPIASPKIKIKIIPTKILGSWAFALTPASPTIPIAIPAARELNPTEMPEDKCFHPANIVYFASGP